jgi:hypothetical protein
MTAPILAVLRVAIAVAAIGACASAFGHSTVPGTTDDEAARYLHRYRDRQADVLHSCGNIPGLSAPTTARR